MIKLRDPLRIKLFSLVFLITLAVSSAAISAVEEQEMLANIQQSIDQNNAKWVAGSNEISRLPRDEQKKLLGLLPEPESDFYEYGIDTIDEYTYEAQLPAHFDWRDHNGKNYMTSVKRQLCGDCWAYAAAGALEGRLAIDGEPGLNLSEQFLVSDCCDTGSCSGGYIISTSKYITETGIPPESCYPYEGRNSSCGKACSDWQNKTYKAPGYTRVSQNVEALKAAVYKRGPVNVGYMVYEDFSSYRSGIYEHTYGKAEGGHAVVVVGYDDTEKYFIVKNSWGANWGENGYFRIAYSQVDNEVNFGQSACVYGDDIDINPDDPDDPDTDDDLKNGETVRNLSQSAGEWLQFRIKVPATANRLLFKTRRGNGDVDLYTRFGSEPTLREYNCRPYRWGNRETCIINNPREGYYYIGLYGYEAFSGVNLTVKYE